MKWLKSLRSLLLVRGVDLVLPLVARLYTPAPWSHTMDDLRAMQPATLGNDLALYLDERGIEIAKNYELHDVRHILLGYEMDAEGEGRLQYFLLGNGNRSLPVILTVVTCFVVMPDQWRNFRRDYARGRRSPDIAAWDYDYLVTMPTLEARQLLVSQEEPELLESESLKT